MTAGAGVATPPKYARPELASQVEVLIQYITFTLNPDFQILKGLYYIVEPIFSFPSFLMLGRARRCLPFWLFFRGGESEVLVVNGALILEDKQLSDSINQQGCRGG
jgi:hypothetical protein